MLTKQPSQYRQQLPARSLNRNVPTNISKDAPAMLKAGMEFLMALGNLPPWFTNRPRQSSQTARYRMPLIEHRLTLLTGDALIVLVATWLAYNLAYNMATLIPLVFEPALLTTSKYWYLSTLMLGSWWILTYFSDIYEIPAALNRRQVTMQILLMGGIGGLLGIIALYTLANNGALSFLFYFGTITLLAVLIWRWLYPSLSSTVSQSHRLAIIGTGERGQTIHGLLQKAPELKYHILGYVAELHQGQEQDDTTAPIPGSVLGTSIELVTLCQEQNIHELVVATEGELTSDILQQLILCQSRGIQITKMPDLYQKLNGSIPIEYVDPDWALNAMQGQPIFNRLQLAGKRIIDLVIVLLGLPFLLLVIPLFACLIKLDSAGPVFYRQERVGRGGKSFRIWKFRTMVENAEKDGTPQWASKDDQRITRIGRFLRKARLDELPQIFNILRGEMSFVGPRPERPEFIKELEVEIPYYHTRLMVKPGLTGWAQICYDYANSTDDARLKLHYDFYYIRSWSLALDIYILFKTVGVVFQLKGM